MKIGFFGTPEIGAYCLGRLSGRFSVAFAVTGRDKPAGRHLRMQPSPVKRAALGMNIPVHHPANLRDAEFIASIGSAGADIFVVVAYGRLIPAEVFTLPPLGTINLHPSLLPRYRGAAPVEWALINGAAETGVTVQVINERLDAGDIVLQERIALDAETSAGELYETLLPRGADMLIASIEKLAGGSAARIPQNEDEATYCGKIDRALARIDWRASAGSIHNLVRGLNPRPGCWSSFRGMTVKVWKTALFGDEAPPPPGPGFLLPYGRKRLLAGTGTGWLEILSIQPETRKAMDALSFINGYRPSGNERFGDADGG
jgi:methionyl-tRNA formyltransferase